MRDKLGRFIKKHKGYKVWLGKKFSKKHRKKLSKARMGVFPWNKGKKTGIVPKTAFKKGQTTGSNNVNWKGGISNVAGYIYLLRPNHPFTTKAGYIKRANLVMEKKLCRYLKPKEIVHHINGIKNDDRPENLQLFKSISEHVKYHCFWQRR